MEWYYVEEGKQVGPVSREELLRRVRAGRITGDTLVWYSDLTRWTPWKELHDAEGGPPIPVSLEKGEGEEVPCSQCGRELPAEEMVRYRDLWVCPHCKEAFLQKLKEGGILGSAFHYGGFWIRLGAKCIDWVVLTLVQAVLAFALAMVWAGESMTGALAQVIFTFFQMGLAAAYTTWFLGRYGATPGKMACGLQVIVSDGSPVGYGRALGRYFGEIVSGMIFMAGYIMAAFDDEKRALHDRICDTRVVCARP